MQSSLSTCIRGGEELKEIEDVNMRASEEGEERIKGEREEQVRQKNQVKREREEEGRKGEGEGGVRKGGKR